MVKPALETLRVVYEEQARDCTRCELHSTRTQVVFGTGNWDGPDILFLGEAPGQDEDQKGYPFIGKAGQLLDKMIEAMGYRRDDCYIANVVSCRPPGNRTPHQEERDACMPIWQSQVLAVQPKMIVALGGVAGNTVLQMKKSVGDLRGTWWEWKEFPVRVTYHPAYLIRQPKAKVLAWEDLQAVQSRLEYMD